MIYVRGDSFTMHIAGGTVRTLCGKSLRKFMITVWPEQRDQYKLCALCKRYAGRDAG